MNPWRQPDSERFSAVIGEVIERAKKAVGREDARVATFGEMVALLWAEGKRDAAIRLEQLWNSLADTHAFSLRCAYPMIGFSGRDSSEPFLKICAEHSGVLPAESYLSLIAEEERQRAVAQLQQKAQSLEAETALHQSEQRFRSLVEGVQDYAIYTMDQHGVITSWNTGARRIKGYTADEIIGQNFSRFYTREDVGQGLPAKVLRLRAKKGITRGKAGVSEKTARGSGQTWWSRLFGTLPETLPVSPKSLAI